MYFNYDEQGNLVGLNCEGKEYFYIRDILGNIIKIVDEDNVCVVEYEYDAWGNFTRKVRVDCYVSYFNPFVYKGYYYDSEVNLYYLNSRYYDPSIGRFISADDVSYLSPDNLKGLNLFAYCENNPIMRYDPNGNVSWWKIGAIALVASGIIIGTALTIATFGAASVAGTIAISSAITFAAKAAEVTTLQIKKSVADGDDNDDIFNDVVDAIVGNAPKIIGLTSITKTGGYSIGIYNQSNLFYEIKDLMKYDGFNLNNLACGSIYALKERFQNVEQYMSMKTSISGYVISYVFAAIAVGNLIYSIFSEDYLELARKRKYKLY